MTRALTAAPPHAAPTGGDLAGAATIATILRHDAKVTSYKIALLRALADLVLAFPDADGAAARDGSSVAVPLRMLADPWVAAYWPFVAPGAPVRQGQAATRGGAPRNDLSFRPALTALRGLWEQRVLGGALPGRASDGYLLVSELLLTRKRAAMPSALLSAYGEANGAIRAALRQPIRYAGPAGEEHAVFPEPRRLGDLGPGGAVSIPGTKPADVCLLVPGPLWLAFRELSLYVEALCVHEWSLFTERVTRGACPSCTRGEAYTLLTDRPDNRLPLRWERNQVDILLHEGHRFTCPWTEKQITRPGDYDLDHVVPVSVYAVNALWNLVPADSRFNSHVKRDRMPSPDRLARAEPHLAASYRTYGASAALGRPLADDAAAYFAVPLAPEQQPAAIARAAASFCARITAARNLPTF